jgi:DNA polymerase III epsilon subunit-like protein
MYHPFVEDRAKAIELAKQYVQADPLFLDTETTGLSDMDEVCEIAVINVKGEVLINTLVKPIRPIAEPTSQIHGITNEMVANAPTFGDLLPRLEQMLRGREVLVYNAEFDMAKIARSAQANSCWFEGGEPWFAAYRTGEETPEGISIYDHHWHCAMELYAQFYGDWNDYHQSYRWQRLTSAALQCGIELPLGIHRALMDAELTRRVILHMAGVQDESRHER